jgi:hypothetical protein
MDLLFIYALREVYSKIVRSDFLVVQFLKFITRKSSKLAALPHTTPVCRTSRDQSPGMYSFSSGCPFSLVVGSFFCSMRASSGRACLVRQIVMYSEEVSPADTKSNDMLPWSHWIWCSTQLDASAVALWRALDSYEIRRSVASGGA